MSFEEKEVTSEEEGSSRFDIQAAANFSAAIATY